jgi:alkaline phosphatase D
VRFTIGILPWSSEERNTGSRIVNSDWAARAGSTLWHDPPVSWPLTTRRAFLGSAAAGAAGLLLPRSLSAQGVRSPLPLIRGARFTESVASGQQGLNGITLWTKLAGVDRTSRLQVEISPDQDFRSVIYRQDVVADVEAGFAVHHRAENAVLRPGEQYFYRFYTCDENSPVGRFRTARPADSQETVRIGFFSCQAYEAGFYTAHTALAAEPDLDVVVCLGDYIYERPFYTGPRQDRLGANRDGEVQTLAEYRDKYALYHSDPRLLELRRQFPMIAIWDDHEVEDNYARDKPGSETQQVRVPFLERRANGYRAFFEHMPRVRVPEEPDRTYGTIPLGANADLFLLDQRQYRDDQPCGDQFFVPCPDSETPGRTYLGQAQKEWLKRGLQGSRAAWKVVANQAMIMSLDGPPRNEVNKDQWDGYAAERAEILEHVRTTGTKDVTFITGDIHTFFAGNVTASGRQGAPSDPPAVATEFVGGAVTSKGILPDEGENSALLVDNTVLANNPHIKFSNMELKGYAVMECAPNECRVVFRAVRTTAAETSEAFDLARFKVDRGQAEVERIGPP